MKPKLVAVGGGTSSGKTTLCQKIKKNLGELVCLISLDSYFYPEADSRNKPEAINIKQFLKDLDKIMAGQKVTMENFNRTNIYQPRPLILVEGHLSLTFEDLFEKIDLSIFVDMDLEERVLRRLERSMSQGGDFDHITSWYRNDVKKNHWQYIEPTRKKADLIIWGKITERRVNILSNILKKMVTENT